MNIERIINTRIAQAIEDYDWENLIKIALDEVNFNQLVAEMIEMNFDISDQVKSYVQKKIEEHLDEIEITEFIEGLPW